VCAVLGTGKGANGAERVRGAKTNPNRALVAVLSCSRPAPVERWRQSAGVCGPAARVGYSLSDLAQQDELDHVVLTEGSDRPERQRRVVGGEVRAAGTGGARGVGRCRASPSF
jgi:hypothetical protein